MITLPFWAFCAYGDNVDANNIVSTLPPEDWRRPRGPPHHTAEHHTAGSEIPQSHTAWSNGYAQNQSLWRMWWTYGAMQSYVACQKLWWWHYSQETFGYCWSKIITGRMHFLTPINNVEALQSFNRTTLTIICQQLISTDVLSATFIAS